MVQIQGVTLNGLPFVVDEQVAIASNGRTVAVEDRPATGRFDR